MQVSLCNLYIYRNNELILFLEFVNQLSWLTTHPPTYRWIAKHRKMSHNKRVLFHHIQYVNISWTSYTRISYLVMQQTEWRIENDQR